MLKSFLLSLLLGCSSVGSIGGHQELEESQITLPLANNPPPAPIRAVGDSPDKVVYGYWPYWGSDLDTIQWDQLSHLAIFSVGLQANGTLSDVSRWLNNAPNAIALGSSWGVKIHLVVTSFSDSTTNAVLSSSSLRQTAIQNISSLISQVGGHGVNIDIEGLDASQRQNMVSFIQELKQVIPEVWIATPAVDWSGAWDYDVLANTSDGLFIMGYDYHWSGGDPGPVGPLYGGSPWSIWSIDWTIQDYRNYLAPDNKIVVGFPLYGREWQTTNNSIPGVSTGTSNSVVYSSGFSGCSRAFDQVSRTPYCFPSQTSQRWVDDLGSMEEKIDYAVSEGLLGFGFWAITYEGSDRSFWVMVDSYSHNNQQPITPSQTITINPVVPGVAGNLNTLSAVGITPNALVGFLAGVGQGQVQIPNCAGWVPAGSARLVGVATANNAGAVSLGLWIPRTARNRTFQVWAYDQTTCQISQPITISL